MRLPLVQLDAFSPRPFGGNPAAVVRLGHRRLPAATMLAIANENNLSETAFVTDTDEVGVFGLRWFTPTLEVDLCGHATLAAGCVVLDEEGLDTVRFDTRSGPLHVRRAGTDFAMDLPRIPWSTMPADPAISEVLGAVPDAVFAVRETHGARYTLARYAEAATVRDLRPDTTTMGRTLGMNIIVTAPADAPGIDFVSRFFAPASGVPEDPVTGSAHCTLAPYWAEVLGRSTLVGHQVSARGGIVRCRVQGGRVTLAGPCARYLTGVIELVESP